MVPYIFCKKAFSTIHSGLKKVKHEIAFNSAISVMFMCSFVARMFLSPINISLLYCLSRLYSSGYLYIYHVCNDSLK